MLTVLRQTRLSHVAGKCVHTTPRRPGYIVLVPEIGEDAQATETIVRSDGLPAFNAITIENCLGAVGQQATAVEQTVKEIETALKASGRMDVERVFRQLDMVTGPLDTTWGIAKALYLGNSNLIPTKSYLNIHERARGARAAKYNSKALHNALAAADTTPAKEQRLRQKYLLEGTLNGLALPPPKLEELKTILGDLGKERTNFRNKTNMAVHSFAHIINDFQLVRDFPATLLEATAKDPAQPSAGPWKITLQPQVVDGFLKYCPDRTQRWNVWQADVRKCSGQMEKSLETSTHLEKIRALRRRQANLLGYPTFADMSMRTKMVGGVEQLQRIFAQLLQHAGPAQAVEVAALQRFASDRGFGHKLDVYDVAYWRRKALLNEDAALDEEILREYFPLPRVMSGLFSLAEKLLGVRIVERAGAEVWQPAVKCYDIFDLDAEETAQPTGSFYVDCYSKEHKFGRNNGWMVSIRNRNEALGTAPLAALVFNFTAPVYGKPYLLNYDDLQMVFRTFGAALQHLLTRAPYTDLAGLSNVEWDASQVAGQVLANLLDNPTILRTISGHYAKDEPIPTPLAEKVRLLKTHLAGHQLCKDLYVAHLDLELHKSPDFWLDVVKKLWPVYRCTPLDKRDSHPCSMAEIFSGDWAAAQFSHVYSRLIAADVTDAFWQGGDDLGAVGKRFKDTFLASGGAVPSAEVFRRFRGRDPSVEALLKSLDIHNPSQTSGDL